MNNEQVKFLSQDDGMVRTVLRTLLQDPLLGNKNMARLDQLATEDIMFARWCERHGVPTSSRWRELTYGVKP